MKRMRWSACLVVLLLPLLLLFSPAPVGAAPLVEETQAVVQADASLPPLIQARMQTSVKAIADQLLAGHPLPSVQADRGHYETVIHEVFDKVLVGYSVDRVDIRPAAIAQVQVHIVPWADTIQTVQVRTTVEGMPPEIEAMVRSDLQGVDKVFSQSIVGLPLAAADWSNGVVKHSLNAFMAEHLPEFRADFELSPDTEAQVQLTVYPRLPVVRTVDLNMRSDTVPNFTLINHRQLMLEKVNLLLGVPVAFVSRHEEALRRLFAATLDSTPDFRLYRLHSTVSLQVAEDTVVMSRSDTTKYRLRLEGWSDIGNIRNGEGDNQRFRLHAGQMMSSKDELFGQLDFFPQHVRWGWEVGYQRSLGSQAAVNLCYDMKENRGVLGASYRLAPRWQLRYEYRWADELGEAALRYRMHDFLSLEYVVDRHDNWLRLIGVF